MSAVAIATILVWIASIAGATVLMRNKGRPAWAGFLLGFFLGLIGVLIAALVPRSPAMTGPATGA